METTPEYVTESGGEIQVHFGEKVREAREIYDSLSFIHSSLDDAEISPEEFRVYGHMLRRAGSDYKAWPSYQSIGDHCFGHIIKSESRRKKAIKAINGLCDKAMIDRGNRANTNGGHTSNVYYIKPPKEWKGSRVTGLPSRVTGPPLVASRDPKVLHTEGTKEKEVPPPQDPMKRNIKQRKEQIDASAYMAQAKGMGLSAELFVALTDAVLKVCGTKTLVDNSDSPDAVWKHNDAKDAALFLARLGYGTRGEIFDLAVEVSKRNDWRNDPTPTVGDLKLFVSKERDDDREAARDTYVQVRAKGPECTQ